MGDTKGLGTESEFGDCNIDLQPSWNRENLIFERTIIYSVENPCPIYLRKAVHGNLAIFSCVQKRTWSFRKVVC